MPSKQPVPYESAWVITPTLAWSAGRYVPFMNTTASLRCESARVSDTLDRLLIRGAFATASRHYNYCDRRPFPIEGTTKVGMPGLAGAPSRVAPPLPLCPSGLPCQEPAGCELDLLAARLCRPRPAWPLDATPDAMGNRRL